MYFTAEANRGIKGDEMTIRSTKMDFPESEHRMSLLIKMVHKLPVDSVQCMRRLRRLVSVGMMQFSYRYGSFNKLSSI